MQAVRVAAALTPSVPPLTWGLGSPPDELSDVRLTLEDQTFHLHGAVVAAGARRSDVLVQHVKSAKAGACDLQSLAPELCILADRTALVDAFRACLDWVYTGAELELPSFAGRAERKNGAAATPTRSRGGGAPTTPAALSRDESVIAYFSSALFGTPAPASPPPAASPAPSAPPSPPADPPADRIKVTLGMYPVLWQLAGSLAVRGLKAALLPLLDVEPLDPRYVMGRSAWARLRLLVAAAGCGAAEVVGALCEQLSVPTIDARSLGRLSPLAVAAAACDPSRYEAVAEMGLLPSSQEEMVARLDDDQLRVPSEVFTMAFIQKHLEQSPGLTPAEQAQLWETCRFAYLPPEKLIQVADAPHVPARMLALACAQAKARAAGTNIAGAAAKLQRLQPRACFLP